MNIILFDGICNLCNATVNRLIKYDTHNKLLFSAQQSASGLQIMKEHKVSANKASVVLIKGDEVFYKSNAIIEIAKLITGWPSLIKYTSFIPISCRDAIYDIIAKYRYTIFGKQVKCAIPSAAQLHKFI